MIKHGFGVGDQAAHCIGAVRYAGLALAAQIKADNFVVRKAVRKAIKHRHVGAKAVQKHDGRTFTHELGIQRCAFDLDVVNHDPTPSMTICAMIWP
jgi:hypothetical protein